MEILHFFLLDIIQLPNFSSDWHTDIPLTHTPSCICLFLHTHFSKPEIDYAIVILYWIFMWSSLV